MNGAFLKKLWSYLYFQSWSWGLWSPPDRQFLTKKIFKFFSAEPTVLRVLFVGVHRYTRSYEQYFLNQEFVTIDHDKNQKKFGGGCHYTASVQEFKSKKFDLIFLNGIIGFGLNEPPQILVAASNLSRLLNSGGRLVLGTNPDLRPDNTISIFLDFFKFSPFPPLQHRSKLQSPITDESHPDCSQQFTFPFLKNAKHEYHFLTLR